MLHSRPSHMTQFEKGKSLLHKVGGKNCIRKDAGLVSRVKEVDRGGLLPESH